MKVYVHKDGKQYGPYTIEQLGQYVQQGNFTTADLACHDGQNWVTVAQVPGFAEATQPAATPSPTTPRRDQVVQEKAVEQQPTPADASNPPSKKKKIFLWSSIGGGATLLVAGLLFWLPGGEEAVQDAREKEAQAEANEANQPSTETPAAKTSQVAKIDLDDPATLERIKAVAIDDAKLEWRDEAGETVVYSPFQKTPYSGWGKTMWDNGQIRWLVQYKDGKLDGLQTFWYLNRRKMGEDTYKDGKLWTTVGWKPDGEKCPVTKVVNGNGVVVIYDEDGTVAWHETYKNGKEVGQTYWYINGQKKEERTHKDGKLISIVVWKPNGEKCPVTDVVDGNGVRVDYEEDGTELGRSTFKDGEEVFD